MASQAELRALMRRASAPTRGTISSKLARYEADGRLACRVCNKSLGDDDALWEPHLASKAHADSVLALKSKIASGVTAAPRPTPPPATVAIESTQQARSQATAPHPVTRTQPSAPVSRVIQNTPAAISSVSSAPTIEAPTRSSTATHSAERILNTSAATASFRAPRSASSASALPVPGPPGDEGGASSALPAGFFDDAVRDLQARGLDPKAVARAAMEREWADFQEFAEQVDREEESRTADELAAAEEHAQLASLENALYKGRVDVVRFVQQKLRSSSGGFAAADDTPVSAVDAARIEELSGPLSLLTAPDASVASDAPDAPELLRIMASAAAPRGPADATSTASTSADVDSPGDLGEDFDDELLDWRSKATKQRRIGS